MLVSDDEGSEQPPPQVKVPPESVQPKAEAGSDEIVVGKATMIRKLIAEHENSRVEFKSSARWNYKKGGQDTAIELAVIKTVAGFMNAKGDTLLIGVDDEGKVLGLDYDYKVTAKGNKDGLELWLTTNFMNCLGKPAAMGLDVSFADIDGKDVCLIDVKPASKPAFVNAPKSKIEDEFYVRMNNQTQRLSKAELLDYEKNRWR